jgi:hypothetical protein
LLQASSGDATAYLRVPSGALPSGTTVSLYPVVITTQLTDTLAAGQTPMDFFAVTWATASGAQPSATIPLTFSISDPAIETGDIMYLVDPSVKIPFANAIENGIVVAPYTTNGSIYVVISTQIAQAPLTITNLSGHVGVPLALSTSGGSGTGGVTYVATNGTALGCSISGSTLKATSAGTCVVTATKVADPTYFPLSSPATTIAMSQLPNPASVTVNFANGKSTLSKSAMRSLSSLSALLASGARVAITGYARANAKLARSRADAVSAFIRKRLPFAVTIKIITSGAAEKVTVAATQP